MQQRYSSYSAGDSESRRKDIVNFLKRYGQVGEEKRMAFAIGELIKEERRLSKMTQEQLATKTGTKKSFISRIENGKSDIQLSTLYRILELERTKLKNKSCHFLAGPLW